MRKFLLLFALALTTIYANAIEIKVSQDSTKQKKYSLNFTGRIEAYAFYDSYRSIDSRNGVQYMMPAKPVLDASKNDINNEGQLRFSAASTRFAIGGAIQLTDKNNVDAYIEADFMGLTANTMYSVRLRHAYARLNLGNSSILFGQTSHLALFEEIAPSTVSFGSGYPYNVLSRPVQFRFTQNFLDKFITLSAAASMFSGDEGAMESNAMVPDFSLRLTVGHFNSNCVSIIGGYKTLSPKLEIVSDSKARMNAFYGGAMGKVVFGSNYAIRAFVMYGGDLTTLGMTGGFAPLENQNGYTPINTLSTWVDIATPQYCGFEFGVFGGYQRNLGSTKDIVSSNIASAGLTLGINNFWRVAPRVWYHYKMLSFGLEYMYTEATWMDSWNNRYLTNLNAPTSHDNRVTLLCRFNF